MELAKSVSKLLLAASMSKARLIVITWYFMFAFGLIYVCFQASLRLQFSIGMSWGGPSFDSNKHRGFKLRLLFKSFPGPLLKSGMGPLARYDNHQEIINRRPEQTYLHLAQDWSDH